MKPIPALRGAATRLGTVLIGAYLDLTLRSIRWRVILDPAARPVVAGSLQGIAIIWHEFLPYAPALWREARRTGNPRRLHVVVSRHRDGQSLSRLFDRWGLDIVAGSTDRRRSDGSLRPKGGAAALRRLLALRDSGGLLGLTPDGPRGPRRVPAPGATLLAARTGLPLLPMAGAARPSLPLGSWDGMRVPLPFARGVLVYGALVAPGDEAAMRAALDDAARRAAEALGRPDR